MKFSKTLREQQVQEWRRMYIAYDRLKRLVGSEKEFFELLSFELDKVDQFCKELKKRAEIGLTNLLDFFPREEFPLVYQTISTDWRFPILRENAGRADKKEPEGVSTSSRYKRTRENRALEFYMAMSKIMRYREMNKTGFRKILKKYDKQNRTSFAPEAMRKVLARSAFTDDKVTEIWEFTKILHKAITPQKYRGRAKRLVAAIAERDQRGDGKSFLAGMMLSVGAGCYAARLSSDFCFWYCALAMADYVVFSFGVLWYVCAGAFVNYTMILDFPIRPRVEITGFLALAGFLAMAHGVSAYFCAPWYAVYAASLAFFALPSNAFCRGARIYLGRTVCETFLGPFLGKVEFRHFFVADHLISLRSSLIYALRVNEWVHGASPSVLALAVVTNVPLGVRISQCLQRHLEAKNRNTSLQMYNVGKYLTALASDTLMLFSDQVGAFVCGSFLACSVFYSLVWDIYVDWMLEKRPKIYRQWFYVFACAFNVWARLCTIGFFAAQRTRAAEFSKEARIWVGGLLCAQEFARRFVWGVIRIEVEHLNNCDQLKVINGPLSDLFYMSKAQEQR